MKLSVKRVFKFLFQPSSYVIGKEFYFLIVAWCVPCLVSLDTLQELCRKEKLTCKSIGITKRNLTNYEVEYLCDYKVAKVRPWPAPWQRPVHTAVFPVSLMSKQPSEQLLDLCSPSSSRSTLRGLKRHMLLRWNIPAVYILLHPTLDCVHMDY